MRVLCLGNDLIGDDAVGFAVAAELGAACDVVCTIESGLNLLDYIQGTEGLVVVDAIQTGAATPGTLYVIDDRELEAGSGPAPHYIGLKETLALARGLGMAVPERVVIVAIEAGDLFSFGSDMDPRVRAAVPAAVRVIHKMLQPARCAGAGLRSTAGRISGRG